MNNICAELVKWRLFTPCIDEILCKPDEKALNFRVFLLATAAFASLIASRALFYFSAFTYPALLIPAGCLLLGCTAALVASIALTYHVQTYAMDKQAVSDYIATQTPSSSVFEWIRKSPSAAKQLVDQKADLNKQDEKHKNLLEGADTEVFKLLIDGGAHPDNCLDTIVASSSPEALKYVLENKKILPLDWTPQQQVDLWMQVPSAKVGLLLSKHGFDVNIRDDKGYTPLLRLVASTKKAEDKPVQLLQKIADGLEKIISTLSVKSQPDKSVESQLHAILDCGADPYCAVTVDGKEINAFELTDDPIVNAVLKERSLT